MSIPGAMTLAPATFTTNSNSPTLPSGASAFLNPATPFGAAFGSSQGHVYLSPRLAAGNTPSTTTFTFSSPTPQSGWGFALGDVDAEAVTVTATGPDGSAVPVSGVGFQNGFNSCLPAPIPGACGGAQSDVPTWVPSTSTLQGNGPDTNGASGWFLPSSPVRTLTFTSTLLTGIPSYQIWFAANLVTLSGTVQAPTGPSGTPAPVPDTPVILEDPAGGTITTTTDTQGDFSFSGATTGDYIIHVTPPPGFEPADQPVDATAGDVTGISIVLAPVPAAAPPAAPAAALTPRFTG